MASLISHASDSFKNWAQSTASGHWDRALPMFEGALSSYFEAQKGQSSSSAQDKLENTKEDIMRKQSELNSGSVDNSEMLDELSSIHAVLNKSNMILTSIDSNLEKFIKGFAGGSGGSGGSGGGSGGLVEKAEDMAEGALLGGGLKGLLGRVTGMVVGGLEGALAIALAPEVLIAAGVAATAYVGYKAYSGYQANSKFNEDEESVKSNYSGIYGEDFLKKAEANNEYNKAKNMSSGEDMQLDINTGKTPKANIDKKISDYYDHLKEELDKSASLTKSKLDILNSDLSKSIATNSNNYDDDDPTQITKKKSSEKEIQAQLLKEAELRAKIAETLDEQDKIETRKLNLLNEQAEKLALANGIISVNNTIVSGSDYKGIPGYSEGRHAELGTGGPGSDANRNPMGVIGGGGNPVQQTSPGGSRPHQSSSLGTGDPHQSSSSIVAKGALAKNQNEAYTALTDLGYDDKTARTMVANFSGESLENPADTHPDRSSSDPNQVAHGIASWDNVRSAHIKEQFGKSPEEMTIPEQMKAFDWETEKYTPEIYKKLHDPSISPEEKLGLLIHKVERPGDPEAAMRKRLAYYNGFNPSKPESQQAIGVGDSIGVGYNLTNNKNLGGADGTKTMMGDSMIAKQGAHSSEILENVKATLKADPDAFKGKNVNFSTGFTNDAPNAQSSVNPKEYQSALDAYKLIKDSGARDIVVSGMSQDDKFGPGREALARFGTETGATMAPNFKARADDPLQAHPGSDYYKGVSKMFKPEEGDPAPKSRQEVLDHLTEMKNRGLITSPQCVNLAMASVGLKYGDSKEGGHVGDWRKAGDITDKTAANTPIATFLDRSYRPSNLYDGGQGVGMPKANKDHAAVLTGQYRRDKDGNLEAEIADQSSGQGIFNGESGHTHWISATGPEGTGGERNLNNYHLIGVKSGGLLGGSRNAETQRLAREEKQRLAREKKQIQDAITAEKAKLKSTPKMSHSEEHDRLDMKNLPDLHTNIVSDKFDPPSIIPVPKDNPDAMRQASVEFYNAKTAKEDTTSALVDHTSKHEIMKMKDSKSHQAPASPSKVLQNKHMDHIEKKKELKEAMHSVAPPDHRLSRLFLTNSPNGGTVNT
jgi:hypothetical protein